MCNTRDVLYPYLPYANMHFMIRSDKIATVCCLCVFPTADPTGIQQIAPVVLLYFDRCHSLPVVDRLCASAQLNPLKHNVPFIVFPSAVCVVERPNRRWSGVIELSWSETR